IVFAAVVAGAAISLGCAGYLAVLVPWPKPVLVSIIVVAMGLLAAKGILESVLFAGILTVIEIAGLMVIVVAGYIHNPDLFAALPSAFP
ncbi:MAG TPA: amino acid permease, partial [Rhodobacteraceae bacterium]|nr:amino acid permease [Paracoccaceae bacterium]